MKKAVAFGEILIDFARKGADREGYPVLTAQPGGAPANFLAAAAKYGMEREMCGKVGDDAFGHLLIKSLESRGIGTKNVVTDGRYFTTLAFVTLDEKEDRRFSFARKPGADSMIEAGEIDMEILRGARLFHFGTLSMTSPVSGRALAACLKEAKGRGALISFDPNIRLPLWDRPKDAVKAAMWGMEQRDIVKISEEEARLIFGLGPGEAAERIAADFEAEVVFVTLGEKGCLYLCTDGQGLIRNPEGIKAADTTGAGDIFAGAAASVLTGFDKKLRELSERQVRRAAAFGCGRAALSTLKSGGMASAPEREAARKAAEKIF